MTTKGWLLLIAVAALLGAGTTAVLGARITNKAQQAWLAGRAVDSAQQVAADRTAAARAAQYTADSVALVASRDTTAQLARELAAMRVAPRRPRAPVVPLAVPDSGVVPVAIVKAAQAMWQRQLALVDEENNLLDRALEKAAAVIARQKHDLDTYDRLLVEAKNDFVAERVQRQMWQHRSESAPITPAPKKLLGFLPVPKVGAAVGAQGGAGMCFTNGPPAPCMYAGGGVTVGVNFNF